MTENQTKLTALGYSVEPAKGQEGRYRWWLTEVSVANGIPHFDLSTDTYASTDEAWAAAQEHCEARRKVFDVLLPDGLSKFRVLGSHPNRTFFDIEVVAADGLSAFGAAALALQEAGEEGDAEFYAAIPSGTAYELPGEAVVTLETVLDPEQAEVFSLAPKKVETESSIAG